MTNHVIVVMPCDPLDLVIRNYFPWQLGMPSKDGSLSVIIFYTV